MTIKENRHGEKETKSTFVVLIVLFVSALLVIGSIASVRAGWPVTSLRELDHVFRVTDDPCYAVGR